MPQNLFPFDGGRRINPAERRALDMLNLPADFGAGLDNELFANTLVGAALDKVLALQSEFDRTWQD